MHGQPTSSALISGATIINVDMDELDRFRPETDWSGYVIGDPIEDSIVEYFERPMVDPSGIGHVEVRFRSEEFFITLSGFSVSGLPILSFMAGHEWQDSNNDPVVNLDYAGFVQWDENGRQRVSAFKKGESVDLERDPIVTAVLFAVMKARQHLASLKEAA